jgi:hypothetical protein
LLPEALELWIILLRCSAAAKRMLPWLQAFSISESQARGR